MFSFFSSYSLFTNSSKALFLEFSFFMYPFCSSLDKCTWIVAGDDIPSAEPISLVVGGYPCETMNFFINCKN